MTMGRDEDEFYLPRLHTLLQYTYPLPYPYLVGMRNRISSHPRRVLVSPLHPHPRSGYIFFNKNNFFK